MLFSKFLAKKFAIIFRLMTSINLKILSNFHSRIFKISPKETSQTASKALFYFCISFILGILLESFIKIPTIFLWGFLFASVVCIAYFYKKKFAIIGFCVLFLVLGITRFQISEFRFVQDEVSKLNDSPEKITLIGQVMNEPDIRDNFQKLKLKIENTKSVVLVTVNRYPEYSYLDKVKITGKLKTPEVFDDFNYQEYLLKDGIYSVMDFPKTELVSNDHYHNVFSYPYEKILQFKAKLKDSILINFAPPHSVILEGIMLGSDKNMAKDVREKLNGTGLSHLTAVSGSNVLILSSIMMAFLLALGFWRGQAFYFSLAFIWLYIIIVGFPASGIRAAIMATVFLSAQKFGRQNASGRVIVLAAAIMLLQNPLLLTYDIGFQLSFLAAMGIIHIKPIIDTFFRIIIQKFHDIKEHRVPGQFWLDIVSITISAQVVTAPIIAYNFKNISLVAPVTNLLVIPVVDWIMVFGFLSALLGIFSSVLGFIFSLPAWLLLSYFLKIMDIFYQPWAVWSIQNISWIWVVVYYAVVIILIWFLNKYQKLKSLSY